MGRGSWVVVLLALLAPAAGRGEALSSCGCDEDTLSGWRQAYLQARFGGCGSPDLQNSDDRQVGRIKYGGFYRDASVTPISANIVGDVASLSDILTFNRALNPDGSINPQVNISRPPLIALQYLDQKIQVRYVPGRSIQYIADAGAPLEPNQSMRKMSFFVSSSDDELKNAATAFLPEGNYIVDREVLPEGCELTRYRLATDIAATFVRITPDASLASRARCILTGTLYHYGFSGAAYVYASPLTDVDQNGHAVPALKDRWFTLAGPEARAIKPSPGAKRCDVARDLSRMPAQ